ncbi:MAG: DUF433 domain-containing protein [Armatimonadetes bacterium]|nr:DUF433 domain-containing protein [Armatimonadota bacterium]
MGRRREPPTQRPLRLTPGFRLGLLARGATAREILDEYEGLERDDIRACLAFAEAALESAAFLLLTKAAA